MSWRDKARYASDSIKNGDIKKYGQYIKSKGSDFIKNSKGGGFFKKPGVKKALKVIVPSVLVIAIAGTAIITTLNSMNEQISNILTLASSWFITSDESDNTEERDVYKVDTSIGVTGCILRPQTGVYKTTTSAAGVGIYKADFPDDLMTLENVMKKSDIRAAIEADASHYGKSADDIINARGEFKSYMSLKAETGNGPVSVGGSSSYAPLWAYVNKSHDFSQASGTIKLSDFDSFYDEVGYFRVANRYGIAIKFGLGTAMGYDRNFKEGDYLDVYLDNGSVIQCIVFTAKREGSVALSYGETTNPVIHDDGSVIEFVTDHTKFPSYSKNPHEVTPEFNSKITGIALAGSWEEDINETGASCTKYKSTDEYNPSATTTSSGAGQYSAVKNEFSGSNGNPMGTYQGAIPSNTVTIQQIIDKEIESGLLTSSSPGVSDRGTAKSMMGWQTLGTRHSGQQNGITHEDHTENATLGIDTGERAPLEQWKFCSDANGDKTHNKNEYGSFDKIINRLDIKAFDSQGFAFVDGRYVVALKAGLGSYVWGEDTKIGDAVDIYLDDGLTIRAWVGDIKGAKDNPSKCIHEDGSIVEFVVDTKKFYGCCNGNGAGNNTQPNDIHPEFKQPVKAIVKVGNWWDNDVNTSISEITNNDGMEYLDENGEPCDPEGAGPCSSTGSWEDNFGAEPGRRTLTNFMATAFSCMGRVTYVLGGGHSPSLISTHIGLDSTVLDTYEYLYTNDLMNSNSCYKSGSDEGLDCSGYVSYVINNTMFNETSGECLQGPCTPGVGKEAAAKGWGSIVKTTEVKADDLQPGDIIEFGTNYGNGHIVIVVGKTSSGDTVIIHAPQGGCNVELAGIGSEAVDTAYKYNEVVNSVSSTYNSCNGWFVLKNSGFTRNKHGKDSYSNRTGTVYRWNFNESGLSDPDGIANMTAEEVLEFIIGDGMGNGRTCEDSTNSNGTVIYLDPGHGNPDLKTWVGAGDTYADKLKADGYIKNPSTGEWGEWRHFGSEGTVGTNCNNCGKHGNDDRRCWFHADPREATEPDITWGICTKLKPLLEEAGFTVIMSRTQENHPSVTKRAEDAYQAGADIQICVHCDYRGGAEGKGYAYCDPTINGQPGMGANAYKGGDWLDKTLKLNNCLCDGMDETMSGKMVRHSPLQNYGDLVLYERATCPTAYLEIGDMANSSELSYMQTEEAQQSIAEGICKGVKKYYGLN